MLYVALYVIGSLLGIGIHTFIKRRNEPKGEGHYPGVGPGW